MEPVNEVINGRASGRVRGSADRRARTVHAKVAKRAVPNRNVVGNRVVVKTASQRRAGRQAIPRLRKLARTSRVQRRAARTRKYNSRFGVGRVGEVRHNDLFLAAVNEVVMATGRADIGRSLLENLDPRLTSTPIGVYAMDVADNLAEMPQVNRAFVDIMVLDEETFAVFFEPVENVNDQALERALSGFGAVDVLVRPGEDIDESTTADLYMFAVTVPVNRLEDVTVVESIQTEDGDFVIDESADLDAEAFRSLVSHSCFETLITG